ncbi:UTP--GlnB (protein PII) uridylyltransferase, GlnD [Roseovarius mucosus DSM 17069]|uniref:Bifunctional uridylyltransferase/uridylyl-removing enzyme n=1 Tax=Roseovarius mucosus DSM 17069 TaxID=1288298 RepID=A0A0A0HNA5_9RHOB|nr:[protein-PII] uridylyltransferase [Roseovarius mucosus]KGM88154.1 UTP--GlnB (protein PII) uridylyltransferase, GlnD [Roseovarius mucosus DSM 17069]
MIQPITVRDDLICPAETIFDVPAVAAEVAQAVAEAGPDMGALRRAVVSCLSARIAQGRAAIAEGLAAQPFAARATTRAYCWLTDCVILTTLDVATRVMHPLPNPTEAERIAVFAVGGYGRGEMAPHSDVDLLFLTPYKITPWAESVIESMLYMLWDLRLKVGHASRTIRDCLRLGAEDYTIRTALLENRFLAGEGDLAEKLNQRLWDDLFKGTERAFAEAKLAERDARHEKQGERYMVEPNVKEGKGGLRDLQSLFWIAKYLHRVRDVSELVALGMFTPEEFATFAKAENFLWAVRCHLHLIIGRPNDQLTFDMQVEVAQRMGYKDTAARRGVEIFMQDYFRHATAVGDLTRIFLTKLEATQIKSEPLLQRLLRRRKTLKEGYVEVHGRLGIVDPKGFLGDPLNLLRLFEEALRTGLLIHPDAMLLVSANIGLIDERMRNDPAAQKLFLDLLLKHGNPERALRRMNELGVLSAFLPEFEPIVAMMQFNMYHHYTVDEHIIQCISHLAQIERRELIEELPVSSSILKEGINRRVLYVALLLHDIGKGREEDHAILGARIARRVGPRLGLKPREVDTVEWLVRYHLLMSDMAQKRDIADPRTVRDFAKAVQTRERLDLLLLLTVCDIRGVGPGTWNNWKASLLRALYRQTRRAMEGGLEDLNREQRGSDAKRNLREALPGWDAKDLKHETSRHYPPYWQGLHVTAHVVFARLLHNLHEDEIAIDLAIDEDRDATRACFALADHPGIFSRLAGALALVGANVVDARTYTSKDGFATAVFWIQDADGHPFEADRLPRLRNMIQKTLKGEVVPREAIKSRDKLKKRERAFRVPTHITFDNDGSEIYTIIEVDTRDRPGLLYDLTRTLAANNVYIASAVIATFGEQVVDTFYVKDMFGLKFHSESKRAALERKLRAAIAEGVERASM